MNKITPTEFALLLAKVYQAANKSNRLPDLTSLRAQQMMLLAARYLRLPFVDEFKNIDKKPFHPDLAYHDWSDTAYSYVCDNKEEGEKLIALVQKVVNEHGKHNAVRLRHIINSQ